MDEQIHIQIFERLASIESKTDELVRRVGIQNGRVADNASEIMKLRFQDRDLTNSVKQLDSYRVKTTEGWERIRAFLIEKSSTIIVSLILGYLLWRFGL